MASSSAVRPLGFTISILPWISSIEVVKSDTNSGRSENAIMKNSSCGLAVRKNSTTASRDFSILLPMLPLMSKITPSEMGASSLEKWRISCRSPFSYTSKLRSEEHTSELQSQFHLVCRLLLEKKKNKTVQMT